MAFGPHNEFHTDSTASKLGWLRAAVLGSNDGIVSLAALVVGVAGATEASGHILITGVAGLLSGALSMGVGEYVSVSSQRDTELVLLDKERYELEHYPEHELEELAVIFEKKGLSRASAEEVARELTAKDAFGVHVREELGIHPEELANPWLAAIASSLAFVSGAIIPLVAIMLPPADLRIPVTFAAVIVALAITGSLSARVSGAPVLKVVVRVVGGGVLAMLITFGIGNLFGVAIA